MARRKRIVYDFKDTYDCVRKCDGVKTIRSKKELLLKLYKMKLSNSIRIIGLWQLFRNPLYLNNTVCKYIVLSRNCKLIIKNVYDNDLFFEDLEALSDYKYRIVISDYDYHPTFRNEDNLEFENPDSKKRR